MEMFLVLMVCAVFLLLLVMLPYLGEGGSDKKESPQSKQTAEEHTGVIGTVRHIPAKAHPDERWMDDEARLETLNNDGTPVAPGELTVGSPEFVSLVQRYDALSGKDKYRVCICMSKCGFVRREDFEVLEARPESDADDAFTFSI